MCLFLSIIESIAFLSPTLSATLGSIILLFSFCSTVGTGGNGEEDGVCYLTFFRWEKGKKMSDNMLTSLLESLGMVITYSLAIIDNINDSDALVHEH